MYTKQRILQLKLYNLAYTTTIAIAEQGTADYNTWQAFPAEQAVLMYAGVACVKLCAVTAGHNMDYLQFVAAPGDVAVGPFGGIAVRLNCINNSPS
jgi:hypothetical protein